ncbi:hypothetical protein niasHT_008294 [Heterodera trifolii]|uniref:Uncharacterized protein n=1 Tax=Heterodera trifolii TaxID=157864 RepID=A0ABD2M1D3_9BILA
MEQDKRALLQKPVVLVLTKVNEADGEQARKGMGGMIRSGRRGEKEADRESGKRRVDEDDRRLGRGGRGCSKVSCKFIMPGEEGPRMIRDAEGGGGKMIRKPEGGWIDQKPGVEAPTDEDGLDDAEKELSEALSVVNKIRMGDEEEIESENVNTSTAPFTLSIANLPGIFDDASRNRLALEMMALLNREMEQYDRALVREPVVLLLNKVDEGEGEQARKAPTDEDGLDDAEKELSEALSVVNKIRMGDEEEIESENVNTSTAPFTLSIANLPGIFDDASRNRLALEMMALLNREMEQYDRALVREPVVLLLNKVDEGEGEQARKAPTDEDGLDDAEKELSEALSVVNKIRMGDEEEIESENVNTSTAPFTLSIANLPGIFDDASRNRLALEMMALLNREMEQYDRALVREPVVLLLNKVDEGEGEQARKAPTDEDGLDDAEKELSEALSVVNKIRMGDEEEIESENVNTSTAPFTLSIANLPGIFDDASRNRLALEMMALLNREMEQYDRALVREPVVFLLNKVDEGEGEQARKVRER